MWAGFVMTTTLNKLRAHSPCESGWKKLLAHLGKTQADDEPLQLSTILESNGIQDAVWALRSLNGVDKELRLFACDCAEHVLYLFENVYPKDNRPRNAIENARKYAQGTATKEELAAAANAANAAYAAAASVAADAADADAAYAYVADAAAYANAAAANAAADAIKTVFLKYFGN